jgi:hypothetical protein
VFRTGATLLGELRKQAEADGRLHIAICTLLAIIAAGILAMRADPEAGIITLRSVLRGWPAMLIAAGISAAALSGLYFWSRNLYRAYAQSVLLESGLLYLALEHEPAEILGSLLAPRALVKFGGGAGLSFRERMLALLRAYPGCCHRLLFQAYPLALRWLDIGLVLGALGLGIALIVLILNTYLPWLQNPYGPPPNQAVAASLRLLGLTLLAAILARGSLRRARNAAPGPRRCAGRRGLGGILICRLALSPAPPPYHCSGPSK